jgi:hypothetical protein
MSALFASVPLQEKSALPAIVTALAKFVGSRMVPESD